MISTKKISSAAAMLTKFRKSLTIGNSNFKHAEVFPQGLQNTFLQNISAIHNRIIHPDPASAVLDPARVLEVRKMPGNSRLRQLQDRHEIAYAEFPIQEKAKDTKTGFVG
jgi:hypothetical protein